MKIKTSRMNELRSIITGLAVLCSAPAFLTSCGGVTVQPTYYTLDGFAIGTSYHIVAQVADSTGFAQMIESTFWQASASMSVYDPNSLLNRLNRNETDLVDDHIAACIATARIASQQSGGVYDITVKPVTEAWGFTGPDPQYRPDLDSLLRYVGYNRITVQDGQLIKEDPAIQLELNSVAKGYIVDLIAANIEAWGSGNYMVEVGGEVFCRGRNRRGNNWVVGIDTPADGNMIPGMDMHTRLSFTGLGLATSGNYRKFYTDPDGNRVVHTINALTGDSRPTNLLSATVLAETCALADAFGTALMALGLEKSIELLSSTDSILGYLIYDDGNGGYSHWSSPGMAAMILE